MVMHVLATGVIWLDIAAEDIDGFSPTSEIDGGGAQHIGGGSPHPSG
jgi:hypothetical protein